MVQFKLSSGNSLRKFRQSADPSGAKMSLSKLTLKDVQVLLERYKIESAVCFMGALVLAVSFWIVSSRLEEVRRLQGETQALLDKEAPVEELKQVMAQDAELSASLLEGVPEKDLITTITRLANKRNVAISSFTPPKKGQEGFLNKMVMELICSAADFRQALLFLNDIEKEPYALRADGWEILSKNVLPEVYSSVDKGSAGIELKIRLSSIEIVKDDKKSKNQ